MSVCIEHHLHGHLHTVHVGTGLKSGLDIKKKKQNACRVQVRFGYYSTGFRQKNVARIKHCEINQIVRFYRAATDSFRSFGQLFFYLNN